VIFVLPFFTRELDWQLKKSTQAMGDSNRMVISSSFSRSHLMEKKELQVLVAQMCRQGAKSIAAFLKALPSVLS